MATLTNIDHLACVHHIPLVVTSPVKTQKSQALHAPLSKYETVRISTRHVPWNRSFSVSNLTALIRYATERINLASDEHHLARFSSLQALLTDIPDTCLGSLVGMQACLLRCVSPTHPGLLELFFLFLTFYIFFFFFCCLVPFVLTFFFLSFFFSLFFQSWTSYEHDA